jgi:hypothetical protein
VSRPIVALILLMALSLPIAARADSSRAIEASLRTTTAASFKSLGAVHAALGLGPQAEGDAAQAMCVTAGSCTLAAALDALQLSALDLRDQARGLQRDDTRLGTQFGKAAVDAVQSTVRQTADLERAARDVRALDAKTLAKKAPALSAAAPKLDPALSRLGEALKALTDYLKYSGVATEDLEKSIAALNAS